MLPTTGARPTPERYRAFAEVEAAELSATYERWARGVAEDPGTVALIDRLPPAKRQVNLVFGAARFHGGPRVGTTASATGCTRTGTRSRRQRSCARPRPTRRLAAPCTCPCSLGWTAR